MCFDPLRREGRPRGHLDPSKSEAKDQKSKNGPQPLLLVPGASPPNLNDPNASSSENDLQTSRNGRYTDAIRSSTTNSSFTRSISRIPTTHASTDHDLHLRRSPSESLQRALIRESNKKGLETQKFFPKDIFDSLMTSDNVKSVLVEVVPRQSIDELVRFILKSAKRVFAILVCIGKASAVKEFKNGGFTDDSLPVGIEDMEGDPDVWTVRSYQTGSDFQVGGQPWTMFHPKTWAYKDISDFCERQWLYMAPIFRLDDPFERKFHMRLPLPFIAKRQEVPSNFSTVIEMEIHPAHINIPRSDGSKALIVAVKSLRQFEEDTKTDRYGKELEVLDIIRKIKHRHLINAIAAYTRGSDRCFVFPWAEGGNLRKFWENHNNDVRDNDLISWIVEQLSGIFGGLRTLHYWDKNLNCRHGDLKPENILLFHEIDGQRISGRGILVVADLGLTKFHSEATKLRRLPTGTLTGTQRYEPPETEYERGATGQPRSRLYDMWSMGCIVLECIIWLLYGFNELSRFNKKIEKFWEIRGDQRQINNEVKRWMQHIDKDPRCGEYTAVRDLLSLVRKRLLVVNIKTQDPGQTEDEDAKEDQDPDYRAYSKETETWLLGVRRRARQGRNYLCDSQLWSKHKNASGPQEVSMHTTSGLLDVQRSPQIPMLARNDRSDQDEDMNLDVTIQVPAIEATDFATTSNRLHTNITEGYNDPFLHTLNDVWESEPDNVFAERFLARIDSSFILPQKPTPSLCQDCTGMDIWRSGFQRDESAESLQARSQYCRLCRMLMNCLQKYDKGYRDVTSFYRTGSALKLSLNGPSVLSICVPPGSRNTPTYAQIGLPRLPEAGNSVHFELIGDWLRNCDKLHQCRPTNRFLPTRVIDVGQSDNLSTIKLHSRYACEAQKYVALSHRWGTGDAWKQACLLRSNIQDRHLGFDTRKLPKAFQDAITVTQALRIRFLWIDSLCIIQDDPEDWATEARLMEDVFSSAYFTIAVSSPKDDGFLTTRPPREFVTIPTGLDGHYYICEPIDDFQGDVEENELNQRGWVLQEHALSPRTIHFTPKQAYWECGNGIRPETLARLLNSKAAFLGDAHFPKSSLKYLKGGRIRLFEILYERYSKLAFTAKTDRAFAIMGLEKRLLKTFNTSGGFGTINLFFHRTLLWKRSEESSNMTRIRYPFHQSVPSWSWMAVDGAIRFLEVPLGNTDWNLKIICPFENEYLSGPESMSRIDEMYSRTELRASAREFRFTRSDTLKRLVTFDTDVATDFESLKCVVVGKERGTSDSAKQKHYVLAVKASPSQGLDAYERVGAGTIWKTHISDGPEIEMRII